MPLGLRAETESGNTMYLYSRGTRIVRNIEETMRIYGELNRLVNANTGVDTHLWASAVSAVPNSVVFTAMVEGRQELADAMQKLALVPEYSGLVEEARANSVPPTDSFRYVLNADAISMDGGPKPIANVMSAQIVGDMSKAFEWSLEMASFSGGLTNSEVMVTVNTVGPMGQINWMVGVDSMGEIDAAEMALWSDAGYMERLSAARAAGMFGPGPGATGASVWMQV